MWLILVSRFLLRRGRLAGRKVLRDPLPLFVGVQGLRRHVRVLDTSQARRFAVPVASRS